MRDRLGYRLLEDVGVTQRDPPDRGSRAPARARGASARRTRRPKASSSTGTSSASRSESLVRRRPDIDPDEYYALLANAADFIVERYDADVVFVPMEKTDVQHSHAVVAHMQNAERAEILRRRYSPRQILDLMGASSSRSACGSTS